MIIKGGGGAWAPGPNRSLRIWLRALNFYPRDALLARYFCYGLVFVCVSVSPSVTNGRRIEIRFRHRGFLWLNVYTVLYRNSSRPISKIRAFSCGTLFRTLDSICHRTWTVASIVNPNGPTTISSWSHWALTYMNACRTMGVTRG